jgi:sporulation protein YlmC with PRC-barrel domain
MDNPVDRIVPLDQLEDYRIAEGDPDVRGWDVLSSDGRRIGEVENLLVDTAAMKVRYLNVEMDSDLMEGDQTRHILIPIGYARLDRKDDQIFVDGLDSASLKTIPAYDNRPLTREFESDLNTVFGKGRADRSIEPSTGPEILEPGSTPSRSEPASSPGLGEGSQVMGSGRVDSIDSNRQIAGDPGIGGMNEDIDSISRGEGVSPNRQIDPDRSER